MNRTARWLSLSVALVALVGLAACGDDSGSSSNTAAPAPAKNSAGLEGTSWVLSSYTDSSGTSVDAVAKPPATLSFTADAVSGSTPCNNFSGTYKSDGSSLTIELGPMTAKACTDDAGNKQEAAITTNMANVASFSIDGSDLTLKDKSGATLLEYTENTVTLEGSAWTATGVNNGKGAVSSTALTEHITATFGPDGALSGSGGCNDYNATYTVDGADGLTIGPIASTRKACADDVMNEESAYFAALGNVAKFEIDGDTLTLRDSSGSTQVTYVAS